MAGMSINPPQTIPAFFADTVARRARQQALGFIGNGELHWRTWHEVADDAARLAAAIQAAGVEQGDRVAQVSENRYEWIITDLALHLAGAVHVPIHVTLSGQQMAEQISDCEARLVFVSSKELLAKFGDGIQAEIAIHIHGHPSEPRGLSRRNPAGINPTARMVL